MPSDAVRVTSLRVEIDSWNRILSDPDQPPHIHVVAGREIAERQLELQALTGEEPSVTMDEVRAYQEAVAAAQRRTHAGLVPQTGGTRINGVQVTLERETALVSDPVDAAVRARRTRGAAMAAQPAIAAHYGKSADSIIPNPVASPTGNLTDNGPVFQRKPTHLSGRTA